MGRNEIRWTTLAIASLATASVVGVLAAFSLGNAAGFVMREAGFLILLSVACIFAWLAAYVLQRQWHHIARYIPEAARFGVVGVMNTVVDLLVLNIVLWILEHFISHSFAFGIAATVSFIAATVNSFIWNHQWTFRDHHRRVRSVLVRFYAVTFASFIVNVGLSWLLVWWSPLASFITPTIWANLAKLISAGVSMLTNFVGYKGVVFRKR